MGRRLGPARLARISVARSLLARAFATLKAQQPSHEPFRKPPRPRPSVCVFCASSNGADPIFLAAATALGHAIAGRGWQLVYGGADVGMMGALADAALAGGAPVIGIIPHALVSREIAHRGLTELIEVGSMHERKAEMARRADAFVALPGGLGTLDELCEILTWALLGIHQKPILLVNTAGYWNAFLHLLDAAVENGFLRANHRGLASVVGTPAQACETLVQHWTSAATAIRQG